MEVGIAGYCGQHALAECLLEMHQRRQHPHGKAEIGEVALPRFEDPYRKLRTPAQLKDKVLRFNAVRENWQPDENQKHGSD